MATRFFSDPEISRLRSWPDELGRDELMGFFSLDVDDRAWLEMVARGAGNSLGLAVQLCALPWLGFVPDDVTAVPQAAVSRVAVQPGTPMTGLAEHGTRAQTRTTHLQAAAARLGWRTMDPALCKDLEEFLLAHAVEHDAPSQSLQLGCEYLRSVRIVRPGPVALMQRIAAVRTAAVGEVFGRVEHLLTTPRRAEFDRLLVVEDGTAVSRLAWLHRGATSASPMAIHGELDKLRYLRNIDAHQLNLSALPDPRGRRLAGVGRRSTNQALARRDPHRRFPVLLATVAQCSVEVLGEIVGMFDLALSGPENRARRKLDVQLAARARASENKLELLEEILVVATDPAVADAEVEVLRELYARGTRKVPDQTPAAFVPTRWRGYLDDAAKTGDITAYRHYWELCTLLAPRDGLRSGDVWVPGSRRYADPTTSCSHRRAGTGCGRSTAPSSRSHPR